MMPDLQSHVARLAAFEGVTGCSLVDGESGLVLESAGEFPDVEQLSEAAVEFWRIHARQQDNFAVLGPLNLIMMAFQNGWLAVTACAGDPSLLLVAVTRRQLVDWNGWLKHARTAVLVPGQKSHA
jgi:hypothetical protein